MVVSQARVFLIVREIMIVIVIVIVTVIGKVR